MRNHVTVDELLREDPQNQTNVRFMVIATISKIVVKRPWFFRCYCDCKHKIYDNLPHGHCEPSNPEDPNEYRISKNTGTLELTCFSDEVHVIIKECNKVVSELGYRDPFTPPPFITALEGTTHSFQLNFYTESAKYNADYILDTVMKTRPHLQVADEPMLACESAITDAETEMLLLTGPDAETGTTTQPTIPTEEGSNLSPQLKCSRHP